MNEHCHRHASETLKKETETETTMQDRRTPSADRSALPFRMELAHPPDVRGRKAVVAGLGVSGIASARWLMQAGAQVTISEIRRLEAFDPKLVTELQSAGITIEIGGHQKETFFQADLIVLSPGVPLGMPLCVGAREKGIPVIGEMELAVHIFRTPVIAITGTNGKSTVTECLGELLHGAGLKAFVGGNLGTPLMTYAIGPQTDDWVVAEVSSSQLDTSPSFHPRAAVILNITPDHLDRYADFNAYVRSKHAIARNQEPGDHLILNDADPHLEHFDPSGSTILRYGLDETERRHAFIRDGAVVVRMPSGSFHRFSLGSFALPGRHNLENVMAVILTALAVGIPETAIQQAIDRFRALPNRLEKVGEQDGVSFYNDSKATNVDAAVRSIESVPAPIVLIAGGRHKGADYRPLADAGEKRIRHAILIGEAKNLIAADFSGRIAFSMAGTLEAAVAKAFALAKPGDTVLLAPACSSFDMFSDYAHRGRVFRQAVEALSHG